MSETADQERLFALLDDVLPKYGKRAFAIPNERLHAGTKGQRVALWRALMRRGVRRGFPDWQIPGAPPRMPHVGGIVVEQKSGPKAPWRPGQVAWLLHYASIGWLAARCDSYADAVALLTAAGYV